MLALVSTHKNQVPVHELRQHVSRVSRISVANSSTGAEKKVANYDKFLQGHLWFRFQGGRLALNCNR